MTLAARVSAFFLAALALILVCFSLAVYALARHYLFERFDRQLHGALHTLVAAVEVEDDDVKFEASDHTVRIGSETDVDDVRWVVVDEQGRLVDRSRNLGLGQDVEVLRFAEKLRTATPEEAAVSGNWRILQHRLSAPNPKPVALRSPIEHEQLVVTTALSTHELTGTLNRLALLLAVLAPAVWAVAAVGGRWYCRKALAPVDQMAREARAIKPDSSSRRLTLTSSGDELASLGTAFNELLDKLFAAYDRQRRFAGDAAHQLRTPLTVLEGEIDVALRRPRSVDEYANTLGVLKQQVGELSQIVEVLLILARTDADRPAMKAPLVNLSEWLTEYLEKWQKHPRWRDFEVSIPDGCEARVAPPLLAQALDNLLGNAVKYSDAGTSIGVSLARRGEVVEITVEDHGIGIPDEERRAVFEPFYRTQAARQSGRPGTGLGLAIAAHAVAALGGTLECSPAESLSRSASHGGNGTAVLGPGVRFRLALPV